LVVAGIAALSIGVVLGLQAARPAVPVAGSIQPKNSDAWVSGETRFSGNQRLRIASLDTDAMFEPWRPERGRGYELASAGERALPAENRSGGLRAASFAERFAGAIDWPQDSQAANTDYMTLPSLLPPREANGRTVARASVARAERSAVPLPASAPANASKKQIRVADLSEDSTEADNHTAIYDIVARKVYMPNGQRLEAHSGFGRYLDDPRYVSEKDRGPTPPNVYDLSLREDLFHGVRAVRLNPVGNGNMFGRDGMLAHTYMLGPNGQSNGCVSFSDYPAFLNAVLSGEVTRLVVVDHLANPPGPKTALGWLPETIRALFGRS
jgi:Protein of unknown function (DUF2778)